MKKSKKKKRLTLKALENRIAYTRKEHTRLINLLYADDGYLEKVDNLQLKLDFLIERVLFFESLMKNTQNPLK
jgi:hypothetical protein